LTNFFGQPATFLETGIITPTVLQIVKFLFLALFGEVIACVLLGVAAGGTHI